MKEAASALGAGSSLRVLCSDLAELAKLRLTFLVLFATLAGFYVGHGAEGGMWVLLHTMTGTAAVAAGAAILNQVLECRSDALMHRTRLRPLPAGRIQQQDALCLGTSLSGLGLVYLLTATNFTTAAIAAGTLFSYLFVYTPLKRVTSLNTLVGAVPGALPPVIGWTAAGNRLDSGALALFLVLFFWQMPHFLSIAWLYREDYARGGFRMLTLEDEKGIRTARKSALYALVLLPCGLFPHFLGLAGPIYLWGVVACGIIYLAASLAFLKEPSQIRARNLFLISIFYLPVVLILMILDRI